MVPVPDVYPGMTRRIFNFLAFHEPQLLLELVLWEGGKIFFFFNKKNDYNTCLVILLNANIQYNLGKCDDT